MLLGVGGDGGGVWGGEDDFLFVVWVLGGVLGLELYHITHFHTRVEHKFHQPYL